MTPQGRESPAGQERRSAESDTAPTVARPRSSRRMPVLRFLAVYTVLISTAVGLCYLVPLAKLAWITSPVMDATRGANVFSPDNFAPEAIPGSVLSRAVVTALIVIGALALSIPVAWIYTFTRRLRYDPSLVQSVIILPAVVAGIVLIVKNSVALAFSLAGIVAAVRFRNTLKDPKDAVYIFLALGIGLAAGVQAMDVALVISLLFNVMVLILWKWDLGAIYSESGRELLTIGDSALLIAHTTRQRDALRWRISRERDGMATDGILVVHAIDPEAAQQALELALPQVADKWKRVDGFRRRKGVSSFAVMLELSKKGDPIALLGEIDERWSSQISAAEYIPFRMEQDKEEKKDKVEEEKEETKDKAPDQEEKKHKPAAARAEKKDKAPETESSE